MIVLVPFEIHAEMAQAAQALAPTATLLPYPEDDGPVQKLDEAEAVLRWVAGGRFSEMVARGPRVRWLHTASAGVDHVLTPAVRAKAGLTVTASGQAFADVIPEFVLAWMLLVTRRLPDLMAAQKERRWESVVQQELFGQTVGIVGLGAIGRGVAVRAKAFGMRTLGLRRHSDPVPFVDEVLTGDGGLARLVRESDWVVLAAALTGDTRALLGAAQFAQMKPGAWLVNIARGAMVDEPALVDALQHGRLGGACLDVFAQEPLPPDNPLWDLPNVHIAPHNSSGGTDALRARQKALFLENLRRFASGEALERVVDVAQGY